MNRREVMAGFCGLAVWPLAAYAQRKVPTVGVLLVTGREPFWSIFRDGLQDLGYVEGRNIRVEILSAEGDAARLPKLAAELVGRGVDIIVASETPAVHAAKQATTDIPIVMAAAGDPVATGLVVSLAKPGGNVTGLSAATAEIAGKSLELIREMSPKALRVGVLALKGNPFSKPFVEQIELAGRELGMEITPILVDGAGGYNAAFATMAGERLDAVILQPTLPHRRAAELALEHRIAALSVSRAFTEAGGLLSYAASLNERYRGAASYVDRILRGATPGDLPIEQPTKFELVINLKTATALGVTIPPALLARADEVIE